jgi:hypothetical protein
MRFRRTAAVILALSAGAASLTILEFLILPSHSFLWREIQNFGHIPLFGFISLAVLVLSTQLLTQVVSSRLSHYLIAFAVTFLIGLVTETIQVIGPRDADIRDQVRNVIGIVVFLGAYLTFDRKMNADIARWGKHAKSLIRAVIVVILVVSVTPMILWAKAYQHRDNLFPVLCGFESWETRRFVFPHTADVKAVPPPPAWRSNQSSLAGRVTFQLSGTYPGFKLEDPVPDWTGYGLLSFDVYSDLDTAAKLTISIAEHRHLRVYEDRFNQRFVVAPGTNRVEILLDSVKQSPATREMNMAEIAHINIFAYRPSDTFSLYFDNFRLE